MSKYKFNLIKPSVSIIDTIDWKAVSKKIETIGRLCWQTEESDTEEGVQKFIEKLIARGHESVLEHFSFTVLFTIDRGVSHELVRHRLASFTQSSTRYIDYTVQPMDFILPLWLYDLLPVRTYNAKEIILHYIDSFEKDNPKDVDAFGIYIRNVAQTCVDYADLKELGWKNQQARAVLPNCLATKIAVTANIREWRKILYLRCDKAAHPQIREVMMELYKTLLVQGGSVFFNGLLDTRPC